MKSNSNRLARGAFTLLELLVVVAIVGVLCAVLASGLQSSFKNAKGVACSSQLRQLGILIQQYAAEHNNELPPSSAYFFSGQVDWTGAWYDPSSSEGPGTGGLAAYTDFKSFKGLVVCPLRTSAAARNQNPPVPEGFPYTVNYHLMPTSGFSVIRTTSLGKASKLMLMADPALKREWQFGLNSYGANLGDSIGSIHRERANVLWADGHVTSQLVGEIEKQNLVP